MHHRVPLVGVGIAARPRRSIALARSIGAITLVVAIAACALLPLAAGPVRYELIDTSSVHAPLWMGSLPKYRDRSLDEAILFTADSDSAWVNLWQLHTLADWDAPAPPKIDFRKEIVIALYFKQREALQPHYVIEGVERDDQGGYTVFYRVIYIHEPPPPPGVIPPPRPGGVTAPHFLLRLPRASGPVTVAQRHEPIHHTLERPAWMDRPR